MKNTNKDGGIVELNFKFPNEEYEFLILCAKKKGVSVNQMAAYFIIKGIHNYEDELEEKQNILGPRKNEKTTWDQMCLELGWDKFDIK